MGVVSGGPLDHAYQLQQLHFHWGAENSRGSEHTLDGRRFPMEMHLVHHRHHFHKHKKNDEEAIAVLGVFFEISEVVMIEYSDHFHIVPALLCTKKTLRHQVGPPPSRQYVAT